PGGWRSSSPISWGRALSPRACQPPATPARLEPAMAEHAGAPTRWGRHHVLVGGALARTSNTAIEEGATLTWADESAFYLLPPSVQTWAPSGQMPHLHVKQTKDHLPAISGITLDGRLFLQVRGGGDESAAVVGLVRVLLR